MKKNNPWETGVVAAGVKLQRVDVKSRIDAAKAMSVEQLFDCLNWPDTQKTVRTFIERQLRKMNKHVMIPPLRIDSLKQIFVYSSDMDQQMPIGNVVQHDFRVAAPVFCRRISASDAPGKYIGFLLTVRGHDNAVKVFNAIQDLKLDHSER